MLNEEIDVLILKRLLLAITLAVKLSVLYCMMEEPTLLPMLLI